MAWFWPFNKQTIEKSGLHCFISIASEGLRIALVESLDESQHNQKSLAFKVVTVLPSLDKGEQQQFLKGFVKEYSLQNVACHYVLNPSEYRLFVLDMPNVSQKERELAARWLIKDLINFPLEEAVIDVFDAPSKFGQSKPKINVFVARRGELKEIYRLISSAGLKLTQINITELALCNILGLLDPAAEGAALVFLDAGRTHVLMTKGKNLYLERQIRVHSIMSPESLGGSGDKYIDLLAELQRTFDYYHVQLGQSYPSKLYLDPKLSFDPGIATLLQKELSIDVKIIDTNQLVQVTSSLTTDKQSLCLSIIGEALSLDPRLAVLKTTDSIEPVLNQELDFIETVFKRAALVPFSVNVMLNIAGWVFVFMMIIAAYKQINHILLQKELQSLEQEQAQMQGDVKRLNAAYVELNKNGESSLKDKTLMESKMSQLIQQHLRLNSRGFFIYLEAFSQNIIPGVWLDNIDIEQGGAEIQLTGKAYQIQPIIEFMHRLNQLKIFIDKPFILSDLKKPTEPNQPLVFELKTPKGDGRV